MGVTSRGASAIYQRLGSMYENINTAIIANLCRLGEELVTYVKDRPEIDSWINRTGNLRSSIGYIVIHDGKLASMSSFNAVNGGMEGSSEGQTFARTFVEKFPKGYALIIVAGMKYAAYVEAIENKDVLASAELMMKPKIEELMNELKESI